MLVEDPVNIHCCDVSTQEGLLDLVTLGNIVSLSHLLDRRADVDRGLWEGAEAERICAQSDFLEFQEVFSEKFLLVIDGEKVHPQTGLFDPFLLQLLVTIVKYKEKMEDTFDDTFSFDTIHDDSLTYVRKYHPHLALKFQQDMKKGYNDLHYLQSFEWLQPFTVSPKAQDQDTEMESVHSEPDDAEMRGKSYIFNIGDQLLTFHPRCPS
jgi:hypothetical protein